MAETEENARWERIMAAPDTDRERTFQRWYRQHEQTYSRLTAFEAGWDAAVERAAARIETVASSPIGDAETERLLRDLAASVRKLGADGG